LRNQLRLFLVISCLVDCERFRNMPESLVEHHYPY